ncbi:hypothetical protein M2165_000424 [Variovorax sp. TBS-050B]|uniref:hypothetical protein n=1 Tax=Variovorax sp. TBS-050B TaxID=2940551 RepID=UPI002475C0F5|nr:hypothetical protein [Variovorax sp. TBS-050B]MDH6590535.1 hypothetical protein [Variovorax sp. TBS-050B]
MSTGRIPTDVIRLRFHGPLPDPAALGEGFASLPCWEDLGCSIVRRAHAETLQVAHVYLQLLHRTALSKHTLAALTDAAGAACPGTSVEAARLTLMQDLAGASAESPARFHYTVEMAPEPGWGIELQRWYDQEHLPGLAAVPGCVRAQRFWNNDDERASLACYDLVSDRTTASAEWLAVRGTAWSDRVRPHFMKPARTMFTLVAPVP